MPLSPAPARANLHHRVVDIHAYARANGLFDIEAHLIDRKPLPFAVAGGTEVPAGQAVHEMWVRLTIDGDMLIHDASAATDAAPYGTCLQAPVTLERMRGVRMGAGWTREIKSRLGGALGCTHLTELLGPMASAAAQALIEHRRSKPEAVDASGRPLLLDSCMSMVADGPVAKRRWPALPLAIEGAAAPAELPHAASSSTLDPTRHG